MLSTLGGLLKATPMKEYAEHRSCPSYFFLWPDGNHLYPQNCC